MKISKLIDNVDFATKNQAIRTLKVAFPESDNLQTQIIDTSTVTLDSYSVEQLQALSSEKFSESEKTALSTALSPIISPRFNIIHGTPFPDVIIGTSYNDIIFAKGGNDIVAGGIGFFTHKFDGNDIVFGDTGNDLFIGGTGNDIFVGGSGKDTADYSFLGKKITLKATGIVEKEKVGKDQLFQTEAIKGAEGLDNTIDGTVSGGNSSGVFFDVNLEKNSLIVNNIPFIGTQKFVVENFVNVIGTDNDDNITGNNSNNLLTGGKGNDVISGKNGKDILIGVSPKSSSFVGPGFNEIDTLLGGSGADKFILGDSKNFYYKGIAPLGNTDYAQIQDFQTGADQIQLKGGVSDYVFSANSFIFLDKGFSVGTLDPGDDLIATVGGTGFANTDLHFV